MSMKENIDFVKDELNSEEKFLENFVKIERFYKKYKKLIISLAVLAVVGVVFYIANGEIDKSNKQSANIAFDKFLADNNDTASLNVLKDKNSKLYQIAQFIKSQKNDEKIDIDLKYFKQLAQYDNAIKTDNVNALDSVAKQSDFLLKEFALFNQALILTKESKYKEAKDILKLIPNDAKANQLSVLLKHYLATK